MQAAPRKSLLAFSVSVGELAAPCSPAGKRLSSYSHSIAAGTCKHLNGRDSVPRLSIFTVISTVRIFRLGAIDGDSCRKGRGVLATMRREQQSMNQWLPKTSVTFIAPNIPPWDRASFLVRPARPRTAPATLLPPLDGAYIAPSQGKPPATGVIPGLRAPNPSTASSSVHQPV